LALFLGCKQLQVPLYDAISIGAAMRKLKIIVPVDGMSATDPYAEQYAAWHLVNGPGPGKQTTLTRISMIQF